MITAFSHVYQVETIGDAYMVVGGVPIPVASHAERVANFALSMQIAAREVMNPITGDPIQVGNSWNHCLIQNTTLGPWFNKAHDHTLSFKEEFKSYRKQWNWSICLRESMHLSAFLNLAIRIQSCKCQNSHLEFSRVFRHPFNFNCASRPTDNLQEWVLRDLLDCWHLCPWIIIKLLNDSCIS